MTNFPFKVVAPSKRGLLVETSRGLAWISTRNVAYLLQNPNAQFEVVMANLDHIENVVAVYRLERF